MQKLARPLAFYTGLACVASLLAYAGRWSWTCELLVNFRTHFALLLGLALDGRGIAWVPANVVSGELARGRLVPAGSADWEIPVEVRLFRPRQKLSDTLERFWSFVEPQDGALNQSPEPQHPNQNVGHTAGCD